MTPELGKIVQQTIVLALCTQHAADEEETDVTGCDGWCHLPGRVSRTNLKQVICYHHQVSNDYHTFNRVRAQPQYKDECGC